MKGILGRKVGMTQVFTKDGKLIPVTVVSVSPNVVTQIRTEEKDGYSAIQLATVDKKEKNGKKRYAHTNCHFHTGPVTFTDTGRLSGSQILRGKSRYPVTERR